MQIPGVETVHAREVWEAHTDPRWRAASMRPPAQDWSRIYRPVAHYPGSGEVPDGDPGEDYDDLVQHFVNMATWYGSGRGYYVGYCFSVDWLGGCWVLRGFDFRSAANKGHNTYTLPIQFVVDGKNDTADRPTPEALATARAIWREARRRAQAAGCPTPFENRPWGHGQLYAETGIGTPTSCPGGGVKSAIADGSLDLDHDPPTIPPGDNDMSTAVIWKHPDYIGSYLVGVGVPLILSPELKQHYLTQGVPEIAEAHDQLLEQCAAATGYTPIPKG